MSKPGWMERGYKPNGPGKCNCPRCGRLLSTSAYATRSHERTCKPEPEVDEIIIDEDKLKHAKLVPLHDPDYQVEP